MSSTIAKIAARAKQIRKKQPGKKWQDCIKQASRELKGSTKAKKPAKKPAKKVAAKKTVYRQTGSSSKMHDESRRARLPGKRVSRSNAVYYERRKNRSDMPGKLSGVGGFKSMAELKKKNAAIGNFFFSPATMKFFNTKIETPIIRGFYFITSDKDYSNTKRIYTIREATPEGRIKSHANKFRTLVGAKSALQKILK